MGILRRAELRKAAVIMFTTLAVTILMALPVDAGVRLAYQAPAGGRTGLIVKVQGLPATSKLVAKPKVKVVGPIGQKRMQRWNVGRGKTLRGLRPGLYAISADYVTAKSGEVFAPSEATVWLEVVRNGVLRHSVTYSSLVPGVVIPPAGGFPIDMNHACKFLMEDPDAKAWMHRVNDPFSWYCQHHGKLESGMNLNRYCWEYGHEIAEQPVREAAYQYGEWWCRGMAD